MRSIPLVIADLIDLSKTPAGIVFVVFGVLLLILGIAGGIEAEKVKIPRLGPFARILSGVFGSLLLVLGLGLSVMALTTPTPVDAGASTPTPVSIHTPAPTPTPAPTSTWKAIINRVDTGTGFTAPDGNACVANAGTMYLAVDVSLQNLSNQTQVLSDSLLDLSDSSGGHYKESQCAGPDTQFTVLPESSIEVTFVFLVPNVSSCFNLAIIDASHNINDNWSIGCR